MAEPPRAQESTEPHPAQRQRREAPPPAPAPSVIVQATPLDVTRRRGFVNPRKAAYKPKPGYTIVNMISAGKGRGQRGLVRAHVKAQRHATTAALPADVAAAIAETEEYGVRDGSGVEMNTNQRENLVRHAVEADVRSTQPRKKKGAADGAPKVKPFDVSLAGRTVANGEMLPAWEVLELLEEGMHDKATLLAELQTLRGWAPDPKPRAFYAPSPCLSDADNRYMRRQLSAIEPLVNELTAELGGREGLSNWIVMMMAADLPGSQIMRRWRKIDSSRALDKLWEIKRCRNRFEIARRRVKMLTPTFLNTEMRRTHTGARQLGFARTVSAGQVPRYDSILQANYRKVAYINAVVPAGVEIEKPVALTPEESETALAELAAAAERRAKAARAQELKEREAIKSEVQKEVEAVMQRIKEETKREPEEKERKEDEGEEGDEEDTEEEADAAAPAPAAPMESESLRLSPSPCRIHRLPSPPSPSLSPRSCSTLSLVFFQS